MDSLPVKIEELDPIKRIESFDEVVSGYSRKEAVKEASRCLRCKRPACIDGCPVGIDIKKFIDYISKNDFELAYSTVKEKNNFPSICGRVCPAEYQCRRACVLSPKGAVYAADKAINIHFLERFVGDYGLKNNLSFSLNKKTKITRERVAVVGSGPAGICCAGELARYGIKVVIFEALHKPGGVLRYGIPPFRIPPEIIDKEIEYLKGLGVEIICNVIVGKTISFETLKKEFSVMFLGLGAGVPYFLGIKGENLCNIYSANEFLTRVNLMGAYKFPDYHTPLNIGKNIVVVGGGNTAIDAARSALRLQKINRYEPNTALFYRRSEAEMPARRLEIEHAKEEGIKFHFLVKPLEFIGNSHGWLRKIICQKCRLGEPDSSGRRRPVPIDGSEFELACDTAIIAIGLGANQLLTKVTPELKVNKYGDLIVDSGTMQTSVDRVYAGGDIVGGEGTVIEAMGMAKKAAAAILKLTDSV
ncbi:MAG: NADPH-dependent glutamate synthase [Candidatus Omnitrophota bacterium]